MIQSEIDALLVEALSVDERPGDRAFARQVACRITESERFAGERRRIMSGALTDGAGMLAIAAGLSALSRIDLLLPFVGDGLVGFASPLVLILALWLGVQRWKHA